MDRRIFFTVQAMVLLLIVSSGCTYTASFNRLPYVNMEAAKQYSASKKGKTPESIAFLKEFPRESHVVLGTLHAPEVEWTALYDSEDLIKAMRKKAAEIGADAIVDYRFRENPTMQTSGSIIMTPSGPSVSMVPVRYKGLHAWGEAIIFIPENQKKLIEAQ